MKKAKPAKIKIICRFGPIHEVKPHDEELAFRENKTQEKEVWILKNVEKISNEGVYLEDCINMYLMQKATELKEVDAMARALLSWAKFIEDENVDPFKPAILHYESPTYGYREHLLIKAKDTTVKFSQNTAAEYIRVVKGFYEFLIKNNVISKKGFFEYQTVNISSSRRSVSTTDLRIKTIKKHGSTLTPLKPKDTQKAFEIIDCMSERDALLINFLLGSGLRRAEAFTMNAELFTVERLHESSSFLIEGIIISPDVGVETKLKKPRELFITELFYDDALGYIESEKHEAALKKYQLKYKDKMIPGYTPLFLTSTGEPFDENRFYNVWNLFKKLYKQKHKEAFKYKPHDLRATFGTSLLRILTDHDGNVLDALDTVKDVLGHDDVSTTLKYVEYQKHEDMLNKAANILDKFASKVIAGLEARVA